MGDREMPMDAVLAKLSGILNTNRDLCRIDGAVQTWRDEVAALEIAISILSALQDKGIESLQGVQDLMATNDWRGRKLWSMQQRYETDRKPIQAGSVWKCPACGRKVPLHHSHCHWCGKKIGGWPV